MQNDLKPLRTVLIENFEVEEQRLSLIDHKEFTDLLSQIYLLPENGNRRLMIDTKDHWCLNETIDHCILASLINQKYTNILTNGFKRNFDGSVTSSLISTHTDFRSSFIRSYPWKILYQLIGPKQFSTMILCYKGYYLSPKSPTLTQLFGESLIIKYTKSQDEAVYISLRGSLYKSISLSRQLNPVPDSKRQLFKIIFAKQLENKKNTSKFTSKLWEFKLILEKLISNHKSCRYIPIFDSICKEDEKVTDNLKLTINNNSVMRFCCIIVDKIFPIETFGSPHNKTIVLSHACKLIKAPVGWKMKVSGIVNLIRIKDIKWLGETTNNLSAPDFQKRKKLYESFLQWFYLRFLQTLLASFFHITHTPTGKELLFYRHRTWNKLSSQFLTEYKKKYLVNVDMDDYRRSKKGKIRLMPKNNNDFRVINIPLRGASLEEETDFKEHMYNEVSPVRFILTKLRQGEYSFFEKLLSTRQIPLILANFRKSFTTGTDFYFMKFDVKTCFDTIPITKVIERVNSMVDPNQLYLLHTYNQLHISTDQVKRWYELKNVEQLNQCDLKNQLLNIGKDRVYGLTGSQILTVVDSELKNTIMKIGKDYFIRKDGIYQGFHLSSMFCDIVYDELIREKFTFLEDNKSLVLRIADDFIIISTNQEPISKAYEMVHQGFLDYGVKINKIKTLTNNSISSAENASVDNVFTFCGYDIDTKSLETTKQFGKIIPDLSIGTFDENSKRIIWGLNEKLKYNTISLKVNSKSIVLKQISIVVESIGQAFYKLIKRFNPGRQKFDSFFQKVCEVILERLSKETDIIKSKFNIEVMKVIIESFLNQFRRKNTKCKNYIEFLKCSYPG